MIYVVYLITYKGTKLPPKYIGSTNKLKLENGYRGSVSSKKYTNIFKEELKNNFDLFSYEILETFENRDAATTRERELQLENNVVKSLEYFNMSIAAPNGFFGRDVSGESNPNFGNKWNEDQRENQRNNRLGKKATDETKKKLSESHSGTNHWNYGKYHSEETRKKISESNKGKSSSFKGKTQIELYGKEKAIEINLKISEKNSGTYEEKYGLDRAKELKENLSIKTSGKNNPNFGNGEKISGDKHFYYGKKRPDASEWMRTRVVSIETREKMSKSQSKTFEEKYGKDKSDKIKEAISERVSGSGNPNSKSFKFTDPDGIETIVEGWFQKFCKDNNIGVGAMYGSIKTSKVCNRGKSKGWKCEAL